VFLEEVWPADPKGKILGEFQTPRGVWIDAENLAALYILEPSLPDADLGWLRRRLGKWLRRS
jgi:hypothetical protein